MAGSIACQQLEVGTRAWTDCVEDAATGGGLMPWIVVVPLGVMVIGMAIGFARQFSAAGRRRAAAHGAAGTAGSWLIFVALIELSIGIGSYVATRKGGGTGFSVSATMLLAVGILLLAVGIVAKARGRRRARIYHSGLPGQAMIRDIRETGMMVNNQPMYEFDLDVEGSGFAPTSATHREVIPLWMAGRISPQTKMPVKVDPSDPGRVIFDWDAIRSFAAAAAPIVSAAGGAESPPPATSDGAQTPTDARGFELGTAAAPPETGTFGLADIAATMRAAREMTGAGSGWHVGRAIGAVVVLFVVAIVGGGLYFIASIFGTVSDATTEVTDQVNEALEEAGQITAGAGTTTIEITRAAEGRAGVGYSVALPVAWNDVTGAVEERQGSVLVDVLMKAQPPSEASIVVTRSIHYLRNPAPEGADVDSVRRGIESELGDAVVRSRVTRLAGEKALAMDLAPGADGLRSSQIAVVRGGQVIFVTLTAPEAEFRSASTVFDGVLSSWEWAPVSAR